MIFEKDMLWRNKLEEFETITSREIDELSGFKPRTSAALSLCASWMKDGFLTMVNSSNKERKYRLSAEYQKLIDRLGIVQQ